jgi:hypothetical protein
MSLCLRDAPRKPHYTVLDISAFPCEVCWLLFGGNGGQSLHHTLRYVVAAPWRTFTLSGPLQTGLWLLRRLRPPQRSLAFSRLLARLASVGRNNAVDFPSSILTDDRTVSCLLHAGWIGDNTFGVRKPKAHHRTVLVQVIQPLHLFLVTTLTTQVSDVSIGSGFDS